MITTIIILSVALIVSVYVNINQIRKQESQEDYITELENSNTEYYNFFQQLKQKVSQANSEIRNADRLGAFEASDFKVNVLPTPVKLSDISSKTWLVA